MASGQYVPSEKSQDLLGPFKSVVELHEIPPGTLGAATVVAFGSAVLISFFALTHIGLDINTEALQPEREQIKAILNSDVPALLLALPAFIGVLIGSWLDLSRLRRASLTTYLALAGTMLLSLASALLFVYDSNRLLTEVQFTTVAGLIVKTDWRWLLLMAVAVTHFLFLLRTLFSEHRHYAERVRRRIDGST